MNYADEIAEWRANRLKKLIAGDGWVTLVGLFWLKPEENRFGSAVDNQIVMDYPALPGHVGTFFLAGGKVSFESAPDAAVMHAGEPVTRLVMKTDAKGDPTVLTLGTLNFHVIERGELFGIRVKDSNADARLRFKGLDYFDADPAWRFEAQFETCSPMKKVTIMNVLGMEEEMDSPGAVVFERNGKSYRLDTVLEPGESDYFVMFADRTNGRQTYGAGRFLYVSPPDDGKTVIDFNKAYTPPCAFSRFATCPLPPPQNRLPIDVTAGELKYEGSDH
ncbi:MAG TPA: DUF1684 domain-containing protein [Gammaproteobacteria bacterium]|nr:DUF1684 domain-containing protein [Gammaproteobacteria bacterium]